MVGLQVRGQEPAEPKLHAEVSDDDHAEEDWHGTHHGGDERFTNGATCGRRRNARGQQHDRRQHDQQGRGQIAAAPPDRRLQQRADQRRRRERAEAKGHLRDRHGPPGGVARNV